MQLTKEQSKQFEEFISKIPISKVRSDIERVWDNVKHSGYNIKTEELDAFTNYAIHLPTDLQTFPQTFSHWVKNRKQTESDEAEQETKKKAKANLGEGSSSILDGVKVVDKDVSDNTVSPYDDSNNRDAEKETDAKKAQRADLTKEAKEGDLHRPVEAMQVHDIKPKKSKVKPVAIPVSKTAIKKATKKKK